MACLYHYIWVYLIGINNAISIVFYTQPCSGGVELVTDSLQHDQFTASTFRDTYLPGDAKLSNGSGWVSTINDKSQYLKIDLKGRWNITGFAIAASDYYNYGTREVRIFYSDDDLVWTPYNSHLSDEYLGERISTYEWNVPVKNISLNPSIKARFVAFNPVVSYGYPALKLELYGCQLSDGHGISHPPVDTVIETTETWIPSQSPVVIQDRIRITSSGNLTIEAGVAVIFTSQEAGIDVYGNLTVTGFGGVPVIFSSNYPVPDVRNKWAGLTKHPGGKVFLYESVIRQATTGYSGGGSGFTMETSVVHSCENGVRISEGVAETANPVLIRDSKVFLNRRGISLHGTKDTPYVTVQRTNVSNNDYNGIEIQNWDDTVADSDANTSLVLTGCSFERNRQSGFVTSENMQSNLHIENSTFRENSQYGLYFNRYYPRNIGPTVLNISECNFSDNLQGGAYLYSTQSQQIHIRVYNNSFMGNRQRALYLNFDQSIEYSNDTVIEINNNTISDQKQGYYPVEIHQRNKRFRMIFQNNTFRESRGAIYATGSDGQMKYVIMHNKFENISDASKSVIWVSDALLEFTNNVIRNATTTTILDIASGYDHKVTLNNFISDESVPCFVKIQSAFDTDKMIKLRNNYWGTDNLQRIKEKICDFFSNVKVARAQVQSFFVDPTLNATQAIDSEDAFVKAVFSDGSYVYGGILNDTLPRPQLTNGTIFVNRSIIVEDSGRLEFAGSHIAFAENRGIILKGELWVADGNDSANATTMASLDSNKKWGGLYLYGGRLSLTKASISSVEKAITINYTDSVNVETTTVQDVTYFIYAENLNQNLTVSLRSSALDLERQAIFVTLNHTGYIDIAFRNTSITGLGIDGTVRITDARGRPTDIFSKMVVQVENSTIDTEQWNSKFINVYSCYVDLNFISSQSSFKTKSDNVYLNTQSAKFDVSQNQFLAGNKAFSLQFCSKAFEDHDLGGTLQIYNNTFDLSTTSDAIYYYNWYRAEHVHTFAIHGNIFKQRKFAHGRGLYFQSTTSAVSHYIDVKNNRFEGFLTSIKIEGKTNNISILGNTFFNNTEVLTLDQDDYYAESVIFASNIVTENHDRVSYNDPEGVIQLHPYRRDSTVRISLIGNIFENNTNTLITTPSPAVLIKHNFFENTNATYNLKVLNDRRYTNADGTALNASLNYWGATNVKTIATKIYDNEYDEALFDIVFRPYLGSRNFSDIQNEDSGFTGENGEIGGPLNKNITLTADGSPYVVTYNIEIEEQGVLNLEAGVTLLFKAAQGVTVVGQLIATGTNSYPVKFLPWTVGDKWRGVDFKRGTGTRTSVLRHLIVNDTLHGITVNDKLLEMSNIVSNFSQENGVVFNILKSSNASTNDDAKSSKGGSTSVNSDGDNALQSVIMTIPSLTAANNTKSGIVVQMDGKDTVMMDLEIDDCFLYGNAEHGIDVLANASVTLRSCSIIDNYRSGVHIYQDFGGRTNLLNSTLARNREYAINSVETNEIVLDNCEIRDHNFGHYGYWGNWETREYIRIARNSYTDMNIIIKDNKFLENIADGIKFDMQWSSHGIYKIRMENNMFEKGNRTIMISDNSYSADNNKGHISITNNTFYNLWSSESEILRFDLRSSSELTFEHNHITYAVAMNIILIEGESVIRENNITVRDNIISGNVVKETISLTSYQDNILLIGNILNNPGSKCELMMPAFLWSSYSVTAKLNYWGTRFSSEIVGKVCGFEQDMSKSYVYYIPYYLDEGLQDVVDKGQNSFSVDGALGGEVSKNLTLTKNNSPYRISRSLMIRYNITLTVEAGVIINFEADRGIYVNGTLMVLGASNETVKLHGVTNDSWHGIVLDSVKYVPDISRCFPVMYQDKAGGNASAIATTGTEINLELEDCKDACLNEPLCMSVSYVPEQNTTLCILYDMKMPATFSDYYGGRHFEKECPSASSMLKFTDIWNTTHGIVAHSPYFSMMASNITNTSSTGILITLRDDDPMVYDFAGSKIENTLDKGMELKGNGILLLVTLHNLTIQNASKHGIYLSSDKGSLTLSDVTVQNCSTAVEIYFQETYMAGNVTMENCKILNNSNGVLLKTRNNNGENVIKLTKNYFFNNTGTTLDIQAPSYEYWYANDYNQTREVDVGYNTFENCTDIKLQTHNLINLNFHDNVIKNGRKETKTNKCLVDVNTRGNRYLPNRSIDISTNVFERTHGTCTLSLMAYDYTFNGRVVYNQFLSNSVEDTVVTINTRHFNLSQNIFDNPDSPFDLYVTMDDYTPTNGTVQAANNWWGSASSDFAKHRVFDYNDDRSLMLVNITPVLTEQTFDCTAVQNCSGNGECVRPNGCRCFSGWAGSRCTDHDCAGVGNCYGNGNCTGPNVCQCKDGWTGSECKHATCFNVNNCSEHGVCVRPDMCTCATDFTGSSCDSCIPYHWGPECRICPACQHGTCDLDNGHCICNSYNWAGYLCDRCNETFYGPDCLPLMMALNIVPNQGIDRGNTQVHVWGHNFPKTMDKHYFCKFGNDIVNGTWIAWNHILCIAPAHPEGGVIVEVSPNASDYTNNRLIYTYYATCPPGACGREMSPPRGQCLFGSCSCNLPWTGDGCTVKLLAPEIEAPPSLTTVAESSAYAYQLVLKTGSTPVRWILVQSPREMTINSGTGLVTWTYVEASSDQYEIRVQASNIVGSDTVTWNIVVHRSYSVVVSRVEPAGRLPVPKPVMIYGDVIFNNESLLRPVPIDVRIRSLYSGHVTSIAELSSPLQPTWSTMYYPKADDVGIFEAYAFHPSETSSNVKVAWSVAGMRCYPDNVNADAVIEGQTVTFKNISVLKNVGESDLPAITSEVNGLGGAFVRRTGTSLTESSQPFLSSLNVNEGLSFDLVITEARPLSGTIYIHFTTSEGTRTSLRVRIKLTIRRPLLIFNPSSLSENVNRDSQKFLDIELKNEGEVAATNVLASLPADPRLSLLSFSNANQTSEETGELTLFPGDTAIMSLAVTTANSALGEMSGTIAVNSDLASATMRYKFYITSIQKLNLTFFVKDEYTYFASGAPLVSGAEVRLSNPRRGYAETRFTTNETGYVIFENITEDQYTIYAQADGHSSFSEIILANPAETARDIFLQRVAVKYTWTVTPTTVEDKYIITLDSTFETYVPMPVVTIEPAKVNTIPYELGQADTIEFIITNHGLIRADNLRFALPSSHPYLIFESTIETIGSIDANTTLIVPVRTKLKKITKRSLASAICGLALLYDYICGGTQTRGLDVTLTREYPGRPPLPCGGGSGGWGGGSGGWGGGGVYYGSGGAVGRGSSVTYNPVTPLSCDCAKTLIKSCALAYHPIAGCAIATADLGTCVSRSGGDYVLTALNCVLGVADTAFACVFGVVCQLCGLFYTTIRCVIDLVSSCGGGSRRRREISSGVVDNVLEMARPVDNFLLMMADIYNDEDMYNLNRTWYDSFKTVIADDSDAGTLLTNDETNFILNTLNDDGSRATLSKFLTRWNNTAAAWENGTLTLIKDYSLVIPVNKLAPRLEQYVSDVDAAKQRGFASIFDEYNRATNAYKDAEKQEQGSGKEEGVCAKVRVRIVQELVLTRDAFNARLEIENGENSDLENIKVEIKITETYGTGDPANDAFSIGQPSLIGITAVDGTGRLGKDLSGSAEWLMIPYSHAAPQDDTLYDVGGRLSYSVGGSEFSVPLLPDTITVKPNPSLVVHYFHEKYVRGDDPMTPEVEPVVPFTLAVMVMNAGYGVARALKISSAQPEIIENEKGLLITFKIIGSQIGNQPMSPSMTVNFGDIGSFETKTARWLLTSTLQGTFYNYSATFENINPLGDPQLSLLDDLGYHELVHIVQIDIGPEDIDVIDDGLGDFLVNDQPDQNGIPEFLYNSANGSDVQPVLYANVTAFNHIETFSRGAKAYIVVELTEIVNASSWYYSRVINNITSPLPADNEYLLQVLREDQRRILVEQNAWQTTHILDVFLFHMLDFVPESENETILMKYNLTYGPRNMYSPRFNASSYSGPIPLNAPPKTFVLKLDAYDTDKDDIHFLLASNNFSLFRVKTTGEIEVNEPPSSVGQIDFVVIVEDSGIPSRSASTTVSVMITGQDGTGKTTISTSSTPSSRTTGNTSTLSTSSFKTTITTSPTRTSTVTTASSSLFTNVTESTSTTSVATSTNGSSSSVMTTISSTSLSNSTTSHYTSSASNVTKTPAISTFTKGSTTSSTILSTFSTTPGNATKDEESKDTPSWVLPTAIGAGVFVVLLVFIALLIYALRRQKSPSPPVRSNSYKFSSQN